MNTVEDRLLRPSIVAKRLGISEDTVIRYFDAGILTGVQIYPNRKRRTIRIHETSVCMLEDPEKN